MRIGHGYDVHRLTEGRRFVLGGVEIPYEKGLLGHSDADVLIHAIIDALLGAAAMGDIGKLFPDTSAEFKDIDSTKLLRSVKDKLCGYKIINIDSTVILQRPKIAQYIPEMRRIIAGCLDIEVSQVNVKATTEEKLGFTGEGLGVAAHAVVLID